MDTAGKVFANSLAQYSQAISEGRIDDAVMHATHIPKYGDLVLIHPDFMHHFNQLCPDVNAKETLHHAGRLLQCVAEAMRQAQQVGEQVQR